MKKTVRWLAMCAAMAALVATAATAKDTLKIGTEGGYPPWSMVDANNKVTGFDADVGKAVCKKLDVKCRFVVQSFDSLIPSLRAGRFDLIISGMSVTPERSKQISFAVPYAVEDTVFVLGKDNPLLESTDIDTVVDGLSGKIIGVQGGTTQGDFLRKRNPKIKVKAYDTLDQMQIDLDSGRLDGTFADVNSQDTFLGRNKSGNFALSKAIIPSSEDPETLGYGIGIGINKKNTELEKRVNEVMCELIDEGALVKSSKKWFHVDISNHDQCKS